MFDAPSLVDDQLFSTSEKLMRQRKTTILILDACHSGKVIANARVYFERHKEALERGSLVVFAACGEKQEATNAGENGVLSKAIAEALTPSGDLDKDGRITLGEMQIFVTRRTVQLLEPLKHKQDCEIAFFGTANKDTVVALTKTLTPMARKFEPPKLPSNFGDGLWDVSALEAKFSIVSCRIDPARPVDLQFTLDLREDLQQPLKYKLVLVDSDGVKTTFPGNANPVTGSSGGRVVLTFTDVLHITDRDKWRNAKTVHITLSPQ